MIIIITTVRYYYDIKIYHFFLDLAMFVVNNIKKLLSSSLMTELTNPEIVSIPSFIISYGPCLLFSSLSP